MSPFTPGRRWRPPYSPSASEPRFQALREHKKINAVAQFFQTNLVYDVGRVEIWLNELARRQVLDKVFILLGITLLKALRMTRYIHGEVPGAQIPDAVLRRMEAAEAAGNP